jgi:hypothetical protein
MLRQEALVEAGNAVKTLRSVVDGASSRQNLFDGHGMAKMEFSSLQIDDMSSYLNAILESWFIDTEELAAMVRDLFPVTEDQVPLIKNDILEPSGAKNLQLMLESKSYGPITTGATMLTNWRRWM